MPRKPRATVAEEITRELVDLLRTAAEWQHVVPVARGYIEAAELIERRATERGWLRDDARR